MADVYRMFKGSGRRASHAIDWRSGLSLRWRLALLVIASSVPLSAFSLIHEYLGYQEDIAATAQETLALARSVSLRIDEALHSDIAMLQSLALSRVLEAGDLVRFRERAEILVAQQFPGASIQLLNEDGQQVVNTLAPAGSPISAPPDIESTRRVFATGQPAVSNLFQGAVKDRPVVAIDVPVKGPDGGVIYVLSLSPNLETFADIIRGQLPSANQVIAVVDRRGVIIARVPSGDRLVGHRAASAAFDRIRTDREGIVESASLDGIPMLSAFSHAERYGWAVEIGVPTADLIRPELVALTRTLAVGGGLLAMGLMLALVAARRIAGPIETLRRLAAATDRDAPPDPAPTGLREVDEVAWALRAAENERRRSRNAEALLRDGIDTIPESFAIYDDDDRLVMCNESYRRLFPHDLDRIVPGIRYVDILRIGLVRGQYALAKGQEEQWLAARLREHREPRDPIERRLTDGSWALVSKRRLTNGWIAGLRIDITELKASEEALRQSERRFQDIAEVSGDWIWETDREHRFTLLAGQRTDGPASRPEAMIGHTRWENVGADPGTDEIWTRHKAELDAHRAFRHFRYAIHAPPVPDMFVSVSGKPVIDRDGVFLGYRGTSTDETLMVEAQRRAEAAELRLQDAIHVLNRRIFETSLDLILVTDRQGAFIRVSPSAMPILGYDPDEMIGRSALDFVHPEDLEATRNEMRMARHAGKTQNFECRYVHKEGRVVTLWWTGVWSVSAHQFFFIGRDITEREMIARRLRDSEEQLKRAQRLAHMGSNLRDMRTGAIEWSDEAYRIYGVSRETFVPTTTNILRMLHPDDREKVVASMAQNQQGISPDPFEYRLIRPDGAVRHIYRESEIINDDRGDPHYSVGIIHDITDRRRVEESLRQSEEQLKRAQALSGIGSDLRDLRAGTREWSDECYRIFGVARETFLPTSENVFNLTHPEDRSIVVAARAKMAAGICPDPFEYRIVRPTGEVRCVHREWEMIRDDAGVPVQVLGTLQDITERKRVQESLRQGEEQLKRAQRLAHMGSDVRNLRTDEAEWSDETYRIFGVSRETCDPSTENFLQMVHPDDRPSVLATREQIQLGICPEPFEYRIIRSDGTVRHIRREIELIRDGAGIALYLAGTVHDVTEQRHTEQQLRQAQKMEAIGNLTGGMAHDFNNLLGIIVGNLGLVQERIGSNAEQREIIGEALDAAWRGADLTRRLLAFARRQPLRPARIDLNELVADTVRLLRRLLGETIEISLSLGDDIWPLMADPAQLEASLTNLATNARDAMPKGGRLIIATANRHLDAEYVAAYPDANEGDFAMIEVSDTGGGMSAETVSHIFEPFFTTKEPGKGTGLGLSMVFGFLRQSGGNVSVYSEPGIGTTFRLYLPRAIAQDAPIDALEEAAVARDTGERVLVVEDNPAMRRIAVRQLCKLGYRVLECDRAADALDLLQSEQVDLLFTDVIMPGGLDGIELARIAGERWPSLKIVLTSGFPEARIDANGNLLGSLQLLSKPYRQEELAAMLRAALDG